MLEVIVDGVLSELGHEPTTCLFLNTYLRQVISCSGATESGCLYSFSISLNVDGEVREIICFLDKQKSVWRYAPDAEIQFVRL